MTTTEEGHKHVWWINPTAENKKIMLKAAADADKDAIHRIVASCRCGAMEEQDLLAGYAKYLVEHLKSKGVL